MDGHNTGPENAAQGYRMGDLPKRGRDNSPLTQYTAWFGADTFVRIGPQCAGGEKRRSPSFKPVNWIPWSSTASPLLLVKLFGHRRARASGPPRDPIKCPYPH